jgi:hypothetical protein
VPSLLIILDRSLPVGRRQRNIKIENNFNIYRKRMLDKEKKKEIQ